MRSNRFVRATVALAAAVALTAPTGAAAAPDRGFTWHVRCEGFGAVVPADAEAVRAEGAVPEHFRLNAEQTGVTDMLPIAAFDCELRSVDGRDTSVHALYSNVTVNVESHVGGYDIWQFTDDRRLWQLLRRLDMPGDVVRDMTIDFGGRIGGVPTSAHASVPWPTSPYTIDADLVTPVVPFAVEGGCWEDSPPLDPDNPCFPSDHWTHGRYGTVYSAHANCPADFVFGTATVTTSPGPLQRMIGEQATGLGFWGRFDAYVRSDLEARYLSGEAARPRCP